MIDRMQFISFCRFFGFVRIILSSNQLFRSEFSWMNWNIKERIATIFWWCKIQFPSRFEMKYWRIGIFLRQIILEESRFRSLYTSINLWESFLFYEWQFLSSFDNVPIIDYVGLTTAYDRPCRLSREWDCGCFALTWHPWFCTIGLLVIWASPDCSCGLQCWNQKIFIKASTEFWRYVSIKNRRRFLISSWSVWIGWLHRMNFTLIYLNITKRESFSGSVCFPLRHKESDSPRRFRHSWFITLRLSIWMILIDALLSCSSFQRMSHKI
jgi:hypothetical protein